MLPVVKPQGARVHYSSRARLLGYSRPPLPFGVVPGRKQKEKCASCIISLAAPTSSAFSASRLISSRNFADKQEKEG
jgi:hypothetical protein